MRTGLLLLGLIAAVLAFLVIFGCEEFTPEIPYSQEEWTAMGWDDWEQGNYDDAIEDFESAIEVDSSYAPAYNGLGWSYLRLQVLDTATNEFATAKLLDGDLIVAFVGSSATLLLDGVFNDSVGDGIYAVAHWANYQFPNDSEGNPADGGSITKFDVHMVLGLDYFSLLQMANCVGQIDAMRAILGELPYSGAMTWAAIAEELNRLDGLNPS